LRLGDLTVSDERNKVIISRIQNRRGLKQDLPQPLRPGELGFAIDTGQLFIGSDPDLNIGSSRISVFEKTPNAQSTVSSIADNNIVRFTVPFKRYPQGTLFAGTTRNASWRPLDEREIGDSNTVFPANTLIVSTGTVEVTNVSPTIKLTEVSTNIAAGDSVLGVGTAAQVVSVNIAADTVTLDVNVSVTAGTNLTFLPNEIKSIFSNAAFRAEDVTVTKNSEVLVADRSGSALPGANVDYAFRSATTPTGTHTVNFRVAPDASDDIAIAYYGNAAVIRALEGPDPGQEPWNPNRSAFGGNLPTVQSTRISQTSPRRNFYTEYQIQPYRQIPKNLITVSAATGTGMIGLQDKHIAVTADSTEIFSPENLVLGNLFVSLSNQQTFANAVIDDANVIIDVPAGHNFDLDAGMDHVYIQDASGSYLDGKLLTVTTANVSLANVTAVIESNSFSVARSLDSITLQDGSSFGANADLSLNGDIDGVTSGMYVRVLDQTSGSNINGEIFQVIDAVPGSLLINSGIHEFNSNVTANVSFIGHNFDPTGNTVVQLFSPNHGYSVGSDLTVTDSSDISLVDNAVYTVLDTSANVIAVQPTAPVTENVTGNIFPVLPSTLSDISVTPVRRIDLTGASTIADVIAAVNATNSWQLNLIPGQSRFVYFNKAPSMDSVQTLNFTLYEDADTATLAPLGFSEKEYTRNDTVKAKLEEWLNSLLESRDINVFNSAIVGAKYNSDPVLTRSIQQGNWLTLNNTFGELLFRSRDEARDFNNTVNRIFSERPNIGSDDIRGLLNIKTNIELQTRQAVVIGDKSITYTDMNTALITAAGGINLALTETVLDAQNNIINDTFRLEYTVTESAGTSAFEKYQRVGTMHVTVRPDFADNKVLLQDIASEMSEPGNNTISFSAEIIGRDLIFTVNNNVGRDLSMKYLIQRWSSR
jgi:hypothetical protein